ncbi:BRO-D [Alphabaculovirus altermyunipunctae]|uniref:BRO-D n=1 Tax=Mythimna unipuncta nucleopolyhedrovirus TaxID=447897 RepID=A0A346TPJ6_9ABAC|nr:BRO-D [Mythimna unipuncta nucleopolyhedrovirus]AXU41506.1 BRO-D [Mythimna unipuncta nucleopolyhedrovirus]
MNLVKKSCTIAGVTCDVWIVEVEKDKFMYGGHGIAQFLGYTKPRNAILQHVKPVWRKNWEVIMSALNQGSYVAPVQLPANWHPHTVFISEAGVYALIMKSKLPAAEEFQRWLFEEVLPELRKTGKYSIQDKQESSSTEIANYDKQLAETQMEVMQLKLNNIQTVAKYDAQIAEMSLVISELKRDHSLVIVEMKRNYEHQMNEYKEREYKMQLAMKDLANAANMTMTQFAVNALLAKDNIEENEQMRQTLTNISGRVVPEMNQQPEKEEYITGYERMVNGKRRIRMCRSQLNEIEQQDKAIQRYREEAQHEQTKRIKMSRRYAWLRDSEKFLQLKCPNPVMVWLKVRSDRPHVFYGLRYTNKLKTEMEVLDENELRVKYRTDMEMCRRNKNIHSKQIEEFKALGLTGEDDCIAKCLTPSVDAKERINAIVENIVENMSKELVPVTLQRKHENAGEMYTAEQVVQTMNNCQNFFVKNMFNIKYYNVTIPPTKALEQ